MQRKLILQGFQEIRKKYSSYIDFCTDGSKTESHVGYATVAAGWERVHRLNSRASLYAAEGYGIVVMLNFIIQNKLPQSIIYTDSLSIMCATSSGYFTKNTALK